MLPSLPGLVSVHDLKTILSSSNEWFMIHQMPESIDEPEYAEAGPWLQMAFQLLPNEPVDTEIETCKETGLVKRIRIRRRPVQILRV